MAARLRRSRLSTDEIAERLAVLGFPVEEIDAAHRAFGRRQRELVSVEKHPNADRLQVCKVDIGGPANADHRNRRGRTWPKDRSCPVAKIGAQLVGLTIAPREMRGVDRRGCCVRRASSG
jgi:phenylalanyl-tRNA synthetase beta chain